MRYLIVSRQNGFGLDQDVHILKGALAEAGIDADVARPRDLGLLRALRRSDRAERIIHVERVHWRWLRAAKEHFVVPNQERFPPRQQRWLERVDHVLTKTRYAEGVFSGLGLPTTFIGFTSTDCRDPEVEKNWSRCLHVAGRSTMKGTEDVIAAWERHPGWPELVILQDPSMPQPDVPANVTLVRRYVGQDELRRLQNTCGIHLCPSRSEGWGHYISEAMSCGAVVITTDAPPMNEVVDAATGVLVPYGRTEPRHLGQCYFVDADALGRGIDQVLAMPTDAKAGMGRAARRRYEENDRGFRHRIADFFGGFGHSG